MPVTLKVDSKMVMVPDGSTLLEAGQAAGSRIPTICYHQATTSNSLCRICVVEVEGQRILQPACTVTVIEGMVVFTRTERVIRARRTILEMLASSVDLSEAFDILDLMEEYGAAENRFPDSHKRTMEIHDDNPMFIRDYSKCILCWRCVQVCADDAQYVNAINFTNRGYETQISTFYDDPLTSTTCVFCGQCIGVCPSGALKTKREYLLEKGIRSEHISENKKSKRSK